MRRVRRARRVGWRTWALGAVGAAVAGTVLAQRSSKLKQLRARARAALRAAAASLAAPDAAAVTPDAPDVAAGGAGQLPAAAPGDDAPWVASRLGTIYYRADCRAATRLAAAHRVTFRNEAEAQAAGYRRSTADGC